MKTVNYKVSYDTNSMATDFDGIQVHYSDDNLALIEKCDKFISENRNVCQMRIDIPQHDFTFEGKVIEDIDFRYDILELMFFSSESIYIFMQNKYDSSIQIEFEETTE